MELLVRALSFALVPAVAATVGGSVAAYRPPRPRYRSYVQHFAAGVVFAAVSVELLPDLHEEAPAAVVAGFAVGVALMLAVDRAGEYLTTGGATGLLLTVGVDVLVDGVLIGVAFAGGTGRGVLVTFALTVEVLFLGLAVVVALPHGVPAVRKVATTAGIGAVLVVGTALGVLLFGGLTGPAMAVVVAFGSAALLYLVTEELLVEAHEHPETPTAVALFFVGFLVLFLVGTAH